MPSADQMPAPFTEESAAQAQDWSVAVPLSIADSRSRFSGGAWTVRCAIVDARSALLRMRLDEAAKAITRLNRLLSNRPHSDQVLYSRVLGMLQACRLAAGDDFVAARNVLTALPPLHGDIVSATILRYVDWKCGAGEQACAPETVDYLAVPAPGQAVYKILNLCISAAIAFDRLHLTVSATLAAEALRLAQQHYGSHSPMSCLPAVLLAQVAYEQGRFDEAETLLAPRLQVIRASSPPECVQRATVLAARLSFHRGRHRAALTILREAESLGRVRRWPRLIAVASAEYARTLLLIRHEGAPSSERDAPGQSISSYVRSLSRPLEGLSPGATPQFSTVAGALVRLAATISGRSRDNSYELLISCLRIGATHGLRMIFVDAGQPVLELLKSLYAALSGSDAQTSDLRVYIATILKAAAPVTTADAAPPTYRQLSGRETGILKLIAHGMSNKRIALSLGITPETVKTHTKSIFVKLSTRTRAQAVARAEAIGLL